MGYVRREEGDDVRVRHVILRHVQILSDGDRQLEESASPSNFWKAGGDVPVVERRTMIGTR